MYIIINYRALISYLSFFSQFPALYLLLVLCALVPFSFFVSFQLFQLLKRDVCFYQMKKDRPLIDTDIQLFDCFSVLVNKKLWFDAIKIMEKNYAMKDIGLHRYFNALGFVYYSIQEYNLAKVYYLRALEIQKSYVMALLNLAKVYKVTREAALLVSTCKTILKYDPVNKIANQYLSSRI